MRFSSYVLKTILIIVFFSFCNELFAQSTTEDGYRAWLRYDQVEDEELLQSYREALRTAVVFGNSETTEAIKNEIEEALPGLLGVEVPFHNDVQVDGTLLIGTPENSSDIANLDLDERLQQIGEEGYLILTSNVKGNETTVIAANTDIGLLYGFFELIRHLQTQKEISEISIQSAPKVEYRTVNHWDNLSRLVERGYAGLSIWDWGTLPEYKDPRYTDYARLNASIGINATAVNNVNADPRMLTDQFLEKLVVLADIFRPYGIKVFISINYQAPISVGGLDTADPLDPEVREWWA